MRRTRSALKLTGDLLPQRIVTRAVRDFKWLGDVTTPTRDLDVYLLEVDDLAKRLSVGAPKDLDDFAAELWRERAAARQSLVRALRSKRFARPCADWRHALTDVVAAGGDDQSARSKDRQRRCCSQQRLTRRP